MKRFIPLFISAVCFISALIITFDILSMSVRYVCLNDYPELIDYGTLLPDERLVFDDILCAVDSGTQNVSIKNTTIDEKKITTHLGLYYGSMEGVSDLIQWEDESAVLDLDLFHYFEEQKVLIDSRVDEAVSSLIEGSDRFKLWQISNYLASRIEYTYGVRDTIDGLNGRGVCATYSMLFYKMSTRIGIQTFICYGYAGDTFHAWNAVWLDGLLYYYDITWYDSYVHDIRYIHSSTPWGRDYTINRK